MGIIKRLKWKDKTGKTTDYDLGAKASNVEQDATHRFVSDTENKPGTVKRTRRISPPDLRRTMAWQTMIRPTERICW